MSGAASVAERITETIIKEPNLIYSGDNNNETLGEICNETNLLHHFVEDLRDGLKTKNEVEINKNFKKLLKIPKYAADNINIDVLDIETKTFLLEMVLETLEYRMENA